MLSTLLRSTLLGSTLLGSTLLVLLILQRRAQPLRPAIEAHVKLASVWTQPSSGWSVVTFRIKLF
jgi:hypothetical protein